MVVSDDYVFFFQAEYGIRDLVRSRGLGDVYKRQGLITITGFSEETGADVVAAVSSIKKSLGGKPLGLSLIHI